MNCKGVFFFLGCAAVAAGCAGGRMVPVSSNQSISDPHGFSVRHETRRDSSFTWNSAALAGMNAIGPAHRGERMRIYVAMKMKTLRGLLRYARRVSTPTDPLYRHYLTPPQIASNFGVPARFYAAVARYFAGFGMHVRGYPQRDVLQVDGTVAQMERAFNTPFDRYRDRARQAIGPVRTPRFSRRLPVTSVVGLVSARGGSLVRDLARAPLAGFTGETPQQLSKAFDYSGAYAAGYTGAGIRTGIIVLGGYAPSDLARYSATYQWPVARLVTETPPPNSSSTSSSPTPSSTPTTAPTPVGDPSEAALDMESVAAFAPAAREHLYVDATDNVVDCNRNTGTTVVFDTLGERELAIANDDADTISLSGGCAEPQDSTISTSGTGIEQIVQAEFAIEGIAFFASSGDDGSLKVPACATKYQENACVEYPASDPNTVGVGGVTAPLDDAGNLIGEITAWGYETERGGPVHYKSKGSLCNCAGSGGGYSLFTKAAPWQAMAVSNTPWVQFSGAREVPDIAMNANPRTGFAMVVAGQPGVGCCTSLAAPMASSMWALVLSACKASPSCDTAKGPYPWRLGNPAPLFYAYYGAGTGSSPAYHRVFYDVLYGDNQALLPSPSPSASPTPYNPLPIGYSAGPGYDLVTGLGVPFAGPLIDAVVPNAGAP